MVPRFHSPGFLLPVLAVSLESRGVRNTGRVRNMETSHETYLISIEASNVPSQNTPQIHQNTAVRLDDDWIQVHGMTR